MATPGSMVDKALASDPAPLGLLGFAMTTFLLSFINAGYLNASGTYLVVPLAIAFGGTAQWVAGILEGRKGNTFGFTAFCGYGAFWYFYAFIFMFSSSVPAGLFAVDTQTLAVALALWGTFTLILWVPSMFASTMHALVFFFLTITFYVLAYGNAYASTSVVKDGGFLGLITAALAAILAWEILVNFMSGRTLLPLGPAWIKKSA